MVRVCFVCLGNICRSPIAEGVMRHLVRAEGLEGSIEVDSAGTAGYHCGDPPDPRACAAGQRRRIEVGGQARQFQPKDFDRFDYVVALDAQNLRDLERAAAKLGRGRPVLLRSFDSEAPRDASVPDPYYGGDAEFEHVIELCLSACRGLLRHIRREHGL